MMFGVTASALTFLAFIICLTSYYIYHKNNQQVYLLLGRTSFAFASSLILILAVILMWGLHTHQFQWQYVFSYSSLDLSAFYLTSTFWGGQEGTFLLWLILGSIYGLIIIKRRVKDESLVMSFLVLVQAFIVIILIKKNPFVYVWDVFPEHFGVGEVPLDGRGLNPLLQNPWMIIHPPILFIGYSSTSILFAFAMSALVRRDYNNWIKQVFPYALFVSLSLGTGIILGGYWAYTTLGWGGYWGWDPVENSSLIPWLISLAFLHTSIIQRRQGGLKKTNIFLALLAFILVLWGSFLTRSGVLADFSVHSFSESELNSYLIVFVALFGGIALLSFLYYTRKVKSERIGGHLITRESFMLFGMLALILSAIFTFLGTSAPLYTGLFSGKASDVSLEYYNLLNAPIAIILGFFISFSPVLSWKRQSSEKLKGTRWQIIASIIISVIAYFLGLQDIIPLIIFFVFVMAILINSEIVYHLLQKKTFQFGGYLAHVGIGLMMIGIITSSVYEKIEKITLPLGISKSVLGYEMKYTGFRLSEDGKDAAVIRIDRDGSTLVEAEPKFYWSEFNQAYMRNPSVHNLWLKDLYISPIQLIPAEDTRDGATVALTENVEVNFEDYLLTFTGYEMNDHGAREGEIFVQALIKGKGPGGNFTLNPAIRVLNQEKSVIPDQLADTDRRV
ncbi:MAG: cytochrome c biogenesis protein CcsA, partial [Deltaproteobacteria bacterium]|nr:cytochrome c biogenesis protein CcsA [Deltaproteobacteria bacterium]